VNNLSVKAICVEVCSTFLFLISVVRARIIFVMVLMRVKLAFDIHVSSEFWFYVLNVQFEFNPEFIHYQRFYVPKLCAI
jgi:hypothetical protein